MSILAEYLPEQGISVEDVLAEVSKELIGRLQQEGIVTMQQPARYSTLNKRLFLGMCCTSSAHV